MKKILILSVLLLGGCAQLQTLELAATSTVTPTQAILAANAYDAIEAGGQGFLTFCASNRTNINCSADNRRSVIKYTRVGRQARNQVETYIQTSTSIPAAIYNAMITATSNLKTTPAANYLGK